MWKHFWLSELGRYYWSLVGKTPNTVKYPTVHRAPPQQRLIPSNMSIVRGWKILCCGAQPSFSHADGESVFPAFACMGAVRLQVSDEPDHLPAWKKGREMKKKNPLSRKDESPKSLITFHSWLQITERREPLRKKEGFGLLFLPLLFSLMASHLGNT